MNAIVVIVCRKLNKIINNIIKIDNSYSGIFFKIFFAL